MISNQNQTSLVYTKKQVGSPSNLIQLRMMDKEFSLEREVVNLTAEKIIKKIEEDWDKERASEIFYNYIQKLMLDKSYVFEDLNPLKKKIEALHNYSSELKDSGLVITNSDRRLLVVFINYVESLPKYNDIRNDIVFDMERDHSSVSYEKMKALANHSVVSLILRGED